MSQFAPVKTPEGHICSVFLPSGLHKSLQLLARDRKVRLSHIVEHILAVVSSSGQLEALCRDIVPRPSEQRENASKQPLSEEKRSVPRRATAVKRRLDAASIQPNRQSDFEKLKSLYEYPGTHLDEECESASKVFLNNWESFSEEEKKVISEAQSRRNNIYEQWIKYRSEVTSCIEEAEKRLKIKTGRAYRMTNAELRKLRAMRIEFETTVRWNLRKLT